MSTTVEGLREDQQVRQPAGATRLLWLHLRIGAQHEMQYRLNFFVQLFNSGLALATGLIAIWLVYNQTDSLGGWSQPELLAVMGIHVMLGGFVKAFVQPNMWRFMQDVQEGTLDYALTRPADSQLLVSVREFSIWNVVDVVTGLGVVVWAVSQFDQGVSILSVAAFVVAVAAGMVIFYCLYLSVSTMAFKVVRSHELLGLLQGVYEAGRWPVSIYPGWMRAGLTFIVPLAFAITMPAEAISGRITPLGALPAVAAAVVAFVIARLVWKWGIRNYSSASS